MKLILICPYYTDKSTAASAFLDNIISRIPANTDYLIYRRKGTRFSDKVVYFDDLPLFNIFGCRSYSIFLTIYYALKRSCTVITDLNPCFSPPFNNNIYHIIHHIDDIPALGILSTTPYQSKQSYQVFRCFDLPSFCWKVMLKISPRNIITVSDTQRNKIYQISKSKNIHVIRNINQMEPHSILNDPLPVFTKPKYDIIMIGHNVRRKNYGLAFKSLEKAAHDLNRKIYVCVVGNDTSSLYQLVQSQMIRVYCLSNLSTTELASTLRSSICYLNTSHMEGYCIPFIESQSLGLIPIVPKQPIFYENNFSRDTYFCDMTIDCYSENIKSALLNHESYLGARTAIIDKSKYKRFSSRVIWDSLDSLLQTILNK